VEVLEEEVDGGEDGRGERKGAHCMTVNIKSDGGGGREDARCDTLPCERATMSPTAEALSTVSDLVVDGSRAYRLAPLSSVKALFGVVVVCKGVTVVGRRKARRPREGKTAVARA
jgi:hypothetical protein